MVRVNAHLNFIIEMDYSEILEKLKSGTFTLFDKDYAVDHVSMSPYHVDLELIQILGEKP